MAWVEEAIDVLAALLGQVHCLIGMPEQRIRIDIGVILLKQYNAKARSNRN
jgi:hypothetical protein